MPTLSKAQRDAILSNAMADAFTKEKKVLQGKARTLAQRVYNELYPPEIQEAIEKLPSNWYRKTDTLRFNAGGYHTDLRSDSIFKIPTGHSFEPLGHLKNAELIQDVHTYLAEVETLTKQISELRHSLRANLYALQTDKQLVDTWPEGRPYYEFLLSKKPNQLPTANFTDVNSVLKLPKKVKKAA